MQCPHCDEEINDGAIKCKFCKEWINEEDEKDIGQQKRIIQGRNITVGECGLPLPIELKKIKLNKNNFSYKGTSYNYNQIIGIIYNKLIQSINGVPSSNTTSLYLKLDNGEKIGFTLQTGMFHKKNKTLAPTIYKILYNTTAQNIINYYMSSFSKYGYIDYEYKPHVGKLGAIGFKKNARIHTNGDIQVGNKSVNIIKARKSGSLQFGYDAGITGINKLTIPSEIFISENKPIPLLGSLSFGKKSITINAEWNQNIIFNILKLLSEGQKIV